MNDKPVLVELDQIQDNPFQMRVDYDPEKIKELAVDIHSNTLLQVPAARQVNGHFELVYGHRRKRAYELLASMGVPDLGIEPDQKFNFMPLYLREMDDFQMFDDGLSENLKRDDLKPTERARAIQKYLDFGKTSKEAAVKFGLGSDATVRGLVRLLDLPEAAQKQLDEGKITQGTARSLLSMQKIAPEPVMLETLKRIEKNPDRNPEDVIEYSIEHVAEVVDMWDDARGDGKPRSSYHNGWPLDMKNFPNKLLPELTAVDMAIALGIQDDQDLIARANTWLMVKSDPLGHNEKRLEFIGELSTELIQKLEHLLNPPACTACPFYTKVRGSHYCGIKTCHTRKSIARNTDKLQQASKNLKIEIYQKSDGAYKPLDSEHRSLFKNRNKGLRLLPKELLKGYSYQWGYDGVDTSLFVVVATGDAIDKMGTSSSRGGKKTDREKAEMRMMKIYRMRRKEMMWEFTATACGTFDAVPETVLKKLNRWNNILMDDSIPDNFQKAGSKDEDGNSNFQRRALVWRLIMDLSSHYRRGSLMKQLTAFQELTQVKAPKTLINRITEWDAEIEAAGKGVSTATKKGKKK